ncbi:AMP-binding protein [Streptomyces sp. TRM 70351]|uniref:AMP-binding protein n=1 Tax=Streptomyces sp. TRM 70351 TaxID=3116552 RepID=UPI002E7BF568|nr:AMP-binding protein [Streptomyces sp. TRM 70351]MEE1929502.1 AMP-binding protein [Streptomyces sp. TRM 70351]
MSADQQQLPGNAPAPTGQPLPAPVAEYVHIRLIDQARSAALAFDRLGVGAGERVAVLLPMSPESVVTTMACGRVDALRVSLPVGEPAAVLRERVRKSGARVVVTVDACSHAGHVYPAKRLLDQALAGLPHVHSVLVVHHVARPVPWTPGRDRWWHDTLATLGA